MFLFEQLLILSQFCDILWYWCFMWKMSNVGSFHVIYDCLPINCWLTMRNIQLIVSRVLILSKILCSSQVLNLKVSDSMSHLACIVYVAVYLSISWVPVFVITINCLCAHSAHILYMNSYTQFCRNLETHMYVICVYNIYILFTYLPIYMFVFIQTQIRLQAISGVVTPALAVPQNVDCVDCFG